MASPDPLEHSQRPHHPLMILPQLIQPQHLLIPLSIMCHSPLNHLPLIPSCHFPQPRLLPFLPLQLFLLLPYPVVLFAAEAVPLLGFPKFFESFCLV